MTSLSPSLPRNFQNGWQDSLLKNIFNMHIQKKKGTEEHESMFYSATFDTLHKKERPADVDLSLSTIILNIGKFREGN